MQVTTETYYICDKTCKKSCKTCTSIADLISIVLCMHILHIGLLIAYFHSTQKNAGEHGLLKIVLGACTLYWNVWILICPPPIFVKSSHLAMINTWPMSKWVLETQAICTDYAGRSVETAYNTCLTWPANRRCPLIIDWVANLDSRWKINNSQHMTADLRSVDVMAKRCWRSSGADVVTYKKYFYLITPRALFFFSHTYWIWSNRK